MPIVAGAAGPDSVGADGLGSLAVAELVVGALVAGALSAGAFAVGPFVVGAFMAGALGAGALAGGAAGAGAAGAAAAELSCAGGEVWANPSAAAPRRRAAAKKAMAGTAWKLRRRPKTRTRSICCVSSFTVHVPFFRRGVAHQTAVVHTVGGIMSPQCNIITSCLAMLQAKVAFPSFLHFGIMKNCCLFSILCHHLGAVKHSRQASLESAQISFRDWRPPPLGLAG